MNKLILIVFLFCLQVSVFSQVSVNVGKTEIVGETASLTEADSSIIDFKISSITNFDYRITCVGTLVSDTVARTVYIYESPMEEEGYVLTDSIVMTGDTPDYAANYNNTVGMATWIRLKTATSVTTQTNSFKFYATVKKDE